MTVARLLHDAGYATGGFGKWGLGNPGTTGVAEKEGFDVFFGYYDQTHAHDYYTDHLIRNSVTVPIQQDGKHTWENYSHTRIANETLKFIEQNKDRPFFCYAAWTPPHGNYVIPSNVPYSQKPWSETVKNYAAMVGLIDKDVGRVMQKLKDLGLDEKTLVIFSSDNGANQEFIRPLGSTGGLRGYKRLLYEGGTRAPFAARWPGHIKPGTTSDLLTTFVDFLPTAADLCGASTPRGLDGISIVPTLLGRQQKVAARLRLLRNLRALFPAIGAVGRLERLPCRHQGPARTVRLENRSQGTEQRRRGPCGDRHQAGGNPGRGTYAVAPLHRTGTWRRRQKRE